MSHKTANHLPFPAKPLEPSFIARSEVMRALEAEVDSAARSDAKVLITGETGVGKEVVARLIHQRGLRASAGMVTLLRAPSTVRTRSPWRQGHRSRITHE